MNLLLFDSGDIGLGGFGFTLPRPENIRKIFFRE